MAQGVEAEAVGWKRWRDIVHFLGQDGFSTEEIFMLLAEHGFALPQIQSLLGDAFPTEEEVRAYGFTPWQSEALLPFIDYKALSEITLTKARQKTVQKIDTKLMQLYVIDHFLSDAECDAVASLAQKRLSPSNTTRGYADGFRTSKTCYLDATDAPFIAKIDRKIARKMGINLHYSEPIQAQYYEVGQEFKLHRDFFDPRSDEFREFGGTRGNRTWTCMIYLQDTPKGGGTWFSEIDAVFYPKKGRALAWNNLLPSGRPNYHTQHAGLPVEEGSKAIITKWFRERALVPMFGEI